MAGYTLLGHSRQRIATCLYTRTFATSRASSVTQTQGPRQVSLRSLPFKLAVIGAGPAGFYAAARILNLPGSENVKIDMYEELPVPFGLVRYGVAPDHPEVKNCIHKFEETASDPRFQYFGNVQIGGPVKLTPDSKTAPSSFLPPQAEAITTKHALSIPLAFLRPYYHSILFTYGASFDRSLGPAVANDGSESLVNVLSARSFVHWYNGHPHSPFHLGEQALDLSKLYRADIIGQGNVALDCARILLSGAHAPTIDRLAKTDTPESVLAELSRSNIQKIDIVGRRGPLQFAGTTKEMRELITLDPTNACFTMSAEDRALVDTAVEELETYTSEGGQMENARMKKRLLGLMQQAKTSSSPSMHGQGQKEWSLSFCKSPVALEAQNGQSEGPLKSIKYELNDLVSASTSTLPSNGLVDPAACVARGTGQTVRQETDFLLKSVGYRSIGIEGLPFDARKGIVRNQLGRVQNINREQIPGLYVSGWLGRGPNGVIATTMYDAFSTAEIIASDFVESPETSALPDLPHLTRQGFGNQKLVGWEEWLAIDTEERRRGQKLGKEREKFVRIEDMLGVLG